MAALTQPTDDDTQKARLLLQVRKAGVTDPRVLAAFEAVPRELFVQDTQRDHAYADNALPIDCGQTISQPSLVAMMTDLLGLDDMMKVLEVGTGSGYQSAILAKLCRRLYTIERHAALLAAAEQRFDQLKLRNITTKVGDGSTGWPEQGTFDRIMVTAAAPAPPDALLEQLAVGGRMIIPIGPAGGDQTLYRIRRTETGYEQEPLFPVRFVPLVGD